MVARASQTMAALGGAYRHALGVRWYVLQVAAGRERAMCEYLTRALPAAALAEPVFCPRYATEMKLHGAWAPVERDLLRGYVVAASAEPELLAESAARLTEFCRVLSTDAGPAPLSPEEAELFGGLGEPGHRCLPMSRGHKLADGTLVVTEGPLAGREGLIVGVDRHKCLAILQMSIAGAPVRARAGLAVLPGPDGAEGRRLARVSRRAAGRGAVAL